MNAILLAAYVSVVMGVDDLGGMELRSLKGLAGLRVVTDVQGGDALKVGITDERIQTAAELRLRRNGIRVFERGNVTSETLTYVRIKVMAIRATYKHDGRPGPTIVTNLTVDVIQQVTLANGQKPFCSTWDDGYLDLASQERASARLMENLDVHLDRLSNDFLKANPKQPVKSP